MKERQGSVKKPIALTTVQIRKGTHRRLQSYCKNRKPRFSMTDVADDAINEFLDRIEFSKAEGKAAS
jgi:hypothetical protein